MSGIAWLDGSCEESFVGEDCRLIVSRVSRMLGLKIEVVVVGREELALSVTLGEKMLNIKLA